MHSLDDANYRQVSGGISDIGLACLEGSSVGIGVGGVLGALVTSPLYYSLLNRGGISSSHHMAGLLVMGAGVIAGALTGSMIGGGSSYIASCQLGRDSA